MSRTVVELRGARPRTPSSRPADDGSAAELVRSAAAGEERAWEGLVARYERLLWSIARSHGLDAAAAADVVQSTWLRLLQHIDRIREPEAIGGWLATTARREALRALHRMSREVPSGDDYLLDGPDGSEPSPEALALAADQNSALDRCVDLLPARCRMLIRMTTGEARFSYKEISSALTMPIGSIGPTRARCLRCLRDTIRREGLSDDWQASA